MGHLKDKYNNDYFLGGVDPDTGQSYGVLGHEHFREGKVHERHQWEFEFTRAAVGTVKDMDVLEIGSGRGDFIPLFLESGVASYTGIDFSESAIDIARERFKDPRVSLMRIDAVELDENKTYDIIGLYDVIEHIPVFEMEFIWKKIKKILRPRGIVVISTPIFDNPNAADHTETTASECGMHCHKQTWGTLARSSLAHGFTIVKAGERIAGLVRREDMGRFEDEKKKMFVAEESTLLKRLGLNHFDGEFTDEIDKKLVPGAGRVAVGCVSDNKPKFLSQALRLLQSLRWFGGSMAGANFFLCVVDEVDPDYAREFERYGAIVRVVERFSDVHPHSNKLRLLELPELSSYDTVILLDCDTAIVQDPWPFLDGSVFQAKIADMPTVPHETFEKLFQHFALKLPSRKYRTDPGGTSTICYCNAGVLVFPKDILKRLAPLWLKYNRELLENLDFLGENKTFCDQASLALALASAEIPYKELPIEMNFPLHLTALKKAKMLKRLDPVILHYHDRIDVSGYLQPSPYRKAGKRIRTFNERLHGERRVRLNNKQCSSQTYNSGSAKSSVSEKIKDFLRKLRK